MEKMTGSDLSCLRFLMSQNFVRTFYSSVFKSLTYVTTDTELRSNICGYFFSDKEFVYTINATAFYLQLSSVYCKSS
jgi:hypothetical protein